MSRPLMKHNPGFLTQEELIQTFVIRHADLELILEKLRDEHPGPSSHVLVLGPRGIGKTTLLLRAAAAIRTDPDLSRRWYPIVFAEESYHPSTTGELWLEALLHLGDQTRDQRWRTAYEDLRNERDDKRLHDRALARLLDFAEQRKVRLVLVLENLNMLLGEQFHTEEGWTLRHTLQNEPRIMLLASTPTRFDEIDNVEKPLFDLFEIHTLAPLSTDECRALWTSVAGSDLGRSRIRAVQILTGGNPRLLSILASFAGNMEFHALMRDLTHLVDEHTSYFKSHLDGLPALERKAYVALADLWRPATAREVAAAARLEVNVASAQLHRLAGRGAVTMLKRGRAGVYQLAERMYNIYHLMRRRGGEDGRVRAVVDFMVHLYDRSDLADVARRIADEACTVEDGARGDHYLAFTALLSHEVLRDATEQVVSGVSEKFFDLADAPDRVRGLRRKQPAAAPERGLASLDETALRERIATDERDVAAMAMLAAKLGDQGRYDDAHRMARQAVAMAPQSAVAWFSLAVIAGYLHERDESEAARQKAVSLSTPPLSDHFSATILLAQGRHEEAARAYRRLVRQMPHDTSALRALASAEIALGNLDVALKCLEAASGLREEALTHQLVARVHLSCKRWEEADRSASAAIRMGELGGEPHLIKSTVALVRDDIPTAVDEVLLSLRDPRTLRAANGWVVDIFEAIAAAGRGREALTRLHQVPDRDQLEPLVVALQIIVGDETNAPQEVMEVASDIVRQIRELQAAPKRASTAQQDGAIEPRTPARRPTAAKDTRTRPARSPRARRRPSSQPG